MISQNCPVCDSARIRRGYKHTPIWNKLVFRYHLLCDNCNWEFIGFAIPLGANSKAKKRKKNKFESNSVRDLISETHKTGAEVQADSSQSNGERKKIKKRVRVKLDGNL